MEIWFMWMLIGLHVLGILSTVALVGKPRTPITGGQAAAMVTFSLLIVAALIIFGNPS